MPGLGCIGKLLVRSRLGRNGEDFWRKNPVAIALTFSRARFHHLRHGDTMNEREIFQSAIEIADYTERQEYLHSACGPDGALRQQVEQLLRAHADASQFLAIPAAAQLTPPTDDPTEVTTFLPNGTSAPNVDSPAEDAGVSLAFLEPSRKPGSLGRLAHYEVLEILGCGAFGTVLKAFDEKLHRMVAIKVLNSELAATSPPRKRFLREAQSSAKIRHENIVSIYAVEEQPLPYIVMEYIPGGTLQQRLDQTGPLNVEEILRLGQQIALGLAAAHAQGLIHRDIKPANILMGAGVEERVKITDFGLARATDDASLTQSGLIAGTPMYMAPEQAKGQSLDHRADLFSLGSVLYTMASGRPPFRAPNTIAVLKRVCEDIPRPIREVIPETPSWLSDIISKLHAKDPDDRFQSAKEVAEVMGQHLAFVREPMKAPRPAPIVLPAELETVVTPKLRRPEKTPGWSPTAILLTVIAGLLVLPVVGIVLLIIGWAIPAYQAAGSRITITPGTGTLIVQSDEPFITAVVDDRRMPLPGREEIELTLPAGPHVVTFWKEGQRLGTKTIQVVAGQNHVARWPDQPGTVLVDVSNSTWQSLFNGRDFTGWQPNSHWKIENGCMVSRVPQNAGLTPAMLVTERADLRDFHVRIEAKINNGGDSGLFFRFGEQGDKALQAQITAAPTAIGSLLREVTTIAASTMTVRPDTWFTLEVIAQGPHITVLVDGVGIVRWADPTGEIPIGPLAFESGFPGTELMIRKVELKSPAPSMSVVDLAWQPLFNGRDLTGWMTHPQQPGNWRVEEGTIVGAGSVSHLFTTRDDFRDFEFRGEVRLSQDGNSGVFLRTPFAMLDPNTSNTNPPGYEVQLVEGNQVHPAQSYLSGGIIPLANPNGANLIQQGQWYKFRVKADGDKFETWIDDVQTVSAIDPQRKYQGGHIALQVWSAKSKVEFRNLEVRNLSSSAKMPVEFNGTWDSVWGPVTLTHAPPNGDQPVELTGTYTLNGPAIIRGTLDPKTRTFRGRFIQTAQEGRLQLTLSEDGKSIIGWYDYLLNESFEKTQPRSSWNLTRQLPRIDFNGEWDSRWGVVTFQHGPISAPLPGPVNGTYYNGTGTIEGTVDPVTRQFIGIFHESSGMSGRIELKLSEDNAAISGTYVYAKNPDQKYDWIMTRKGLPKSPPTAIAPFDASQAVAHQVAWAKHLGVPVEYTNSLGMKFRLIPSGEFLMGSTADEVQTSIKIIQQVAPNDVDWQKYVHSESPQHKVLLTQPYYLGSHEVTQRDYEAVMGGNPSRFAKTGQTPEVVAKVAGLDTARFAVENVSWNDAAEFCAKLSQREQLKPVSFRAGNTVTKLDGNGYRLPTEAQWEFACRAGTTTRFSSGDGGDRDLLPSGWFWTNGGQRMHTVGELKANPFGLFDMHGNASEFVEDAWGPGYYEQFTVDPAIDPPGAPLGEGERINRILRGGFWQSGALACRSGSRFANDQLGVSEHVGFRVVLPIEAVKQSLSQSKAKPAEIASLPPTPAPAKRRFASEEWIDVLPLIDPQLDKWDVVQKTGKNAWRIERGELVVARDPRASKLLLPLDSDWPAFECELELTRRAGESGLNLNIPTRPGECPLVFDPPKQGGVHLGASGKGKVLATGTQLTTGQRTTIHVTVRRQQEIDQVSVAVNGATVGEWSGDRNAIAYTFYEGFPNDRRLSLWVHGGGNEFVFHRIRVRMLDGGTAETLRPVATDAMQAARAVVVEKELFRDQMQQRHDAGTASALELIDTEIELSEATAHLNRVEGKTMGVLAALTNLVSLREREHALIAELVTAGVRINSDLLQADARLRDVRGRLDSALASTPAVVPFDATQAKIFQSAWAKHLDVPVEYTNAMGMKFRLIPPGTFLMGATEDEIRQLSRDLEQANASDFDKFVARFAGPQHWVKITQPYYLASHEVTVGQYREFIEASRHIPTMEQLGVKRFHWQDCAIEPNPTKRAVIGVSWDDASAFCRWASKKHGLKYELPTEAQWEYACRAGTTTLWSFGNDVAELAEYAVIGRDSFWPAEVVGTKKPNPFELWDMHGNADEWCLDWHDSEFYRTGPPNDPVCLANPKDKNSGRVARGGTSHSTPWWTRSATRPWDFPATPNNPKGFRPTLTVETVKAAIQAVAATIPESEWQPLFNGKDLAGWKPHPDDPGEWHVENGVLIGSGKQGYLFSERDDFTNFHLRAEVQIDEGGDSGIVFRSTFLKPDQDGLPAYEAHIQAGKPRTDGWNAGAIGGWFPQDLSGIKTPAEVPVNANEPFVLEVIAQGDRIETRVNGTKAASSLGRHYTRGHIALQPPGLNTKVQFLKIEVRPLSP